MRSVLVCVGGSVAPYFVSAGCFSDEASKISESEKLCPLYVADNHTESHISNYGGNIFGRSPNVRTVRTIMWAGVREFELGGRELGLHGRDSGVGGPNFGLQAVRLASQARDHIGERLLRDGGCGGSFPGPGLNNFASCSCNLLEPVVLVLGNRR